MSRPFPYTYISCPCSQLRAPDPSHRASRELSARSRSPSKSQTQDEQTNKPAADEDDDEEPTFSPRSPRANYSLYPPEQLLYCEDCHQIKCPRCITEEIVCWYCPNCLFETPSSMVRSEGNRWVFFFGEKIIASNLLIFFCIQMCSELLQLPRLHSTADSHHTRKHGRQFRPARAVDSGLRILHVDDPRCRHPVP